MLFGNSRLVGVFFLDNRLSEVFARFGGNKALMASYLKKKDKTHQLTYYLLGKFSITIDALKSSIYRERFAHYLIVSAVADTYTISLPGVLAKLKLENIYSPLTRLLQVMNNGLMARKSKSFFSSLLGFFKGLFKGKNFGLFLLFALLLALPLAIYGATHSQNLQQDAAYKGVTCVCDGTAKNQNHYKCTNGVSKNCATWQYCSSAAKDANYPCKNLSGRCTSDSDCKSGPAGTHGSCALNHLCWYTSTAGSVTVTPKPTIDCDKLYGGTAQRNCWLKRH